MDDDPEVIRLLTEIKTELEKVNETMDEIKNILTNDRKMMWKLLMMVIGGAFLLIGIRLYLPA